MYKGYILLPKKESSGFVWPQLTVERSTIEGAGMGVFATEDLPTGAMIPIIGHKQAGEPDSKLTHAWQYTGATTGSWVDGDPRRMPYNNIGNGGLSISMMINESPEPNCVFRSNFVIVSRDLEKGEELFLYYGESYENNRLRMQYQLDRPKNLNKLIETAYEVTMPPCKERRDAISFLNFQLMSLVEARGFSDT